MAERHCGTSLCTVASDQLSIVDVYMLFKLINTIENVYST